MRPGAPAPCCAVALSGTSGKPIAYQLDWSTIWIENLLNLRFDCSNPFETDVEEMIDFVRTSQEVNLHNVRLAGVPRRESQA